VQIPTSTSVALKSLPTTFYNISIAVIIVSFPPKVVFSLSYSLNNFSSWLVASYSLTPEEVPLYPQK